MMEQYSGDFLAAVDGLRALLGCRGRVWPVSVEQASLCARYGDGRLARGEVDVDAKLNGEHGIDAIWLDPPVQIHRRSPRRLASSTRSSSGPAASTRA